MLFKEAGTILVDGNCTDTALTEFKRCMKLLGDGVEPSYAEIRYNTDNCDWNADRRDMTNYKLMVCFSEGKGYELKIFVSMVTSGYHGAGPSGTIEVLRMAGFNISSKIEEIVYTCKQTKHRLFPNGGVELI